MKIKNFKLKINKYNPTEIESKWQNLWEENKVYSPNLDSAKRPFYNLMMFPYPSAEGMHVGNMYAFTGSDIFGRFKRMQGFSVFEPIGLDGFGIHSENYAIKVGRHPKEQAKISEANFYRQLHATGNGFDWSRTVETYDPDYYKWTQWIFIQLFKAGLAYRKKAPVNFCPSCKTVLADEQIIDGRCERCETEVEKKELEQWFFKITTYADRLLNNLERLDWTPKVKIAQENWIGRSEGTTIRFVILTPPKAGEGSRDSSPSAQNDIQAIDVFTTRADTLYGATFLVLSPEHPFVAKLLKIKNQRSKIKDIKEYVQKAKKETEQERIAQDREKTGVFMGLYAINPLNNEKIPIWIADYAIMGFGTGALFGDAHDERDVEFAKKYKIPLKPTIKTGDKEKDKRIRNLEECYTGYGTLFDSGEFSGLTSKEAIKKITEWLTKEGKGGKKTTYHLRDWLISRQRYWGPPIPMIYCEKCAGSKKRYLEVGSEKLELDILNSRNLDIKDSRSKISHLSHQENPMYGWYPEENLPVLLPDVKDWRPEGSGKSPLANHPEFYKTKCPSCKGEARRETDVSDTFLDSAWYFLRYLATDRDDVPFPISRNVILSEAKNLQDPSATPQDDIKNRTRWLPVNMYIGGAEHSVLHLLYSRFLTMVFKDLGLISFEEPFTTFRAHGLLISGGAKMSKSKGNVVIPDQYIKKYGADTLRTYLMFAGPFEQGGDFRDTGIEGMFRFLNRVWRLVSEATQNQAEQHAETRRNSASFSVSIPRGSAQLMQKTIKKVTEDIENLRYNTAIASLMEYYNFLSKQKSVSREELRMLVLLLAPFAPYLTEELWEMMNADLKTDPRGSAKNQWESVHLEPWPSYDPKFLEEDEVTIVVQVNGKVRDTLKVESSRLAAKRAKFKVQSYVEERARGSERVKKYLEGKKIKKVVYVEGKIINFVTD